MGGAGSNPLPTTRKARQGADLQGSARFFLPVQNRSSRWRISCHLVAVSQFLSLDYQITIQGPVGAMKAEALHSFDRYPFP